MRNAARRLPRMPRFSTASGDNWSFCDDRCTGREAPIPAVRATTIEPLDSTQSRPAASALRMSHVAPNPTVARPNADGLVGWKAIRSSAMK